jgi:Leucine Rich repeat
MICILPASSFAANQETNEGRTKTNSAEVRTLVFPSVKEFGKVALVPHAKDGISNRERIVGPAFGTVKVRVAKDEWLVLELMRQGLENPTYLDSCSAIGVDGLRINFLSMNDGENGWCDAALKHANHFKHLKCLILNCSDVSDASVSSLSQSGEIQFFSAFETPIKGDCFKSFPHYKNLQHLSCFDDAIKQENLEYLSQCPRLSSVDVRRTGIGDLGVKYLSRCPSITTLRLGGNPKISDACVKYLLNLKHVNWLDLDGTSVTFRGLSMLKPMNLDLLTVSEGTCKAKDLPALKRVAKHLGIVSQASTRARDKRDAEMFTPVH